MGATGIMGERTRVLDLPSLLSVLKLYGFACRQDMPQLEFAEPAPVATVRERLKPYLGDSVRVIAAYGPGRSGTSEVSGTLRSYGDSIGLDYGGVAPKRMDEEIAGLVARGSDGDTPVQRYIVELIKCNAPV